MLVCSRHIFKLGVNVGGQRRVYVRIPLRTPGYGLAHNNAAALRLPGCKVCISMKFGIQRRVDCRIPFWASGWSMHNNAGAWGLPG